MFDHNMWLPLMAGLGVTVVAENTCGGIWDSTVLVAFFTVTIPLLVGQWIASRRKTNVNAEVKVVPPTENTDAGNSK